ncbi:ABC transporter permease [Staphylococcus massiliensis]|uniref:ABC transporter permease n=1 Tax=Staphylococcus massiliensis TaxID=555791 RepID=UPI00030F12DC|nr:ABC transporter permease [Staphylococcus massiliensis]MCG3400697.1 ABC transporter permease [Staphylococcus massiliensis]MCG3411635.1 ABC transporter permease [Staphylococcus massiliensis]POA01477.1 ABC transporter permease [Staphylococcus massiliensis CCUG 55927]
MKLALKELKFYKFKYMLITLIVILLATMVLFISGLAQGLGRENISMIDEFKSEKFIVHDDSEDQLTKSKITPEQQKKIEDEIGGKPMKSTMQALSKGDFKEDVMFVSLPDNERPSLESGDYPKEKNEVVLNKKIKAEGVEIGDEVKLKDADKTLKVSGFFNDAMYSHSSVGLLSEDMMDDIKPVQTSMYPVKNGDVDKVKDIDGVHVVSKKDLTDAIPSYQAEQAPLTMMIASLFIITAIVLTAFFYVMTIQKTSEIGILKAIGIKTSHLLMTLLMQIVFITVLGTVISLLIILGLSAIMPITMPFHITPLIMGGVFLIFIVVAIIGALLSIIRVFKIDAIEAIGGAN